MSEKKSLAVLIGVGKPKAGGNSEPPESGEDVSGDSDLAGRLASAVADGDGAAILSAIRAVCCQEIANSYEEKDEG